MLTGGRFPFYQDIRACFMLWLVLPQTQGATKLYFEYVHPTLTKHEAEIEELISRAHDHAKAAGAEYVQHLMEIAKQLLFGALPHVAAAAAPPGGSGDAGGVPPPHDAASFAQHLFARWRVPPLTPYAPQMATDFYNFLSSALQQQQQQPGSRSDSGLIPAHVKTPADKARFIELQRQRLQTVMAALESEMAHLRSDTAAASADDDLDAAAAAAGGSGNGGNGGGLFKSYSQGHLSTYEGDFDHVSMADAAAPPAASTGAWFWGWGAKPATAAGGTAASTEKPHDE